MVTKKRYFHVGAFLLVCILFSIAAYANKNPNSNEWYLDHVVIVVKDLSQATKDFTQLGFTVIPGGKSEHAKHPDHNALIPLPDKTYIELYSPIQTSMINELQVLKKQGELDFATKNLNAIAARFANHLAAGEGLADFAISAPGLNLKQEITELQQNGLMFAGPIQMDRVQSSGKKILWNVAVPKTNDLPFLITDITQKSWRIGEAKPLRGKNGVTGIASITIVVSDLSKISYEYQILLGEKPINNVDLSLPDAKTTGFKIGNSTIILAQPTNRNTAMYKYLLAHGVGPYRLTLYTTNKSAVGKLNLSLTHNAYINLMHDN